MSVYLLYTLHGFDKINVCINVFAGVSFVKCCYEQEFHGFVVMWLELG